MLVGLNPRASKYKVLAFRQWSNSPDVQWLQSTISVKYRLLTTET